MKSRQTRTFNAQAFLDSAGFAKKIVAYRRTEVIFTQGDQCEHVLYIQKGGVKLSVLSKAGREAVVAMLGPGEFFGEGCLAGQSVRMGSATATTDSTILRVDKNHMVRLLHKQHALSDRFIAHMLARNIRIEEDLIDQLFNSSEKRLARTLLLLARYGKPDKPVRAVPISQETLAKMIGTTRSRVNFFMKKFQRLGFIDYTDGLKVNNSLLTVVLHDCDALRFVAYQRTPIKGSFDQFTVSTDTNQVKTIFVTWTCSRTILGNKLTSDSATAGTKGAQPAVADKACTNGTYTWINIEKPTRLLGVSDVETLGKGGGNLDLSGRQARICV